MYSVQKLLAAVLISFFLGGMFLCIGMSATAHVGMQASDMHCMGGSSDTDCSPSFDHTSYWNHILSVIPSDLLSVIAGLLIVCAYLVFARRIDWTALARMLYGLSSGSPSRLLLPRSSLQDAFSNGILHPKLYQCAS